MACQLPLGSPYTVQPQIDSKLSRLQVTGELLTGAPGARLIGESTNHVILVLFAPTDELST